jgi:hypothetical protein
MSIRRHEEEQKPHAVRERNFLKKTLFWTYRKRMVKMKLRNSFKGSVILKEVSNQEQTYVEIKKGNLVTGEQQVLERWTEYFKDLLCKSHEETTIDEKIYYGPEPFISPPTANVVYNVIRKLSLTELQVMTA